MTPQDAAKSYLDTIERLNVHIDIYKSELSHIRDLKTRYNKDPGLTGILKRPQNKYNKLLERACAQRQGIINQINGLEDPTDREILKSIYIEHQTINKIADRLYYGVSTVHLRHRNALIAFHNMFLDDNWDQQAE